MPATAVVGLQWGDEGKGKVVDYMADGFQAIARFNGGSNAGHTVVVDGVKLTFHLIPSGALRRKQLLIGNGVAVDPEVLLQELQELRARGVQPDLVVSDRAHLTLELHKLRDMLDEKRRGASAVGTTLRGISPTFADRASRVGVRLGDLLDGQSFTFATTVSGGWNSALISKVYGGDGKGAVKRSFDRLKEFAAQLRPYVGDAAVKANDVLRAGGNLLLEGAQGFHLDVDFGTYPYVTATHATAGYAAAGLGIPSRSIQRVVGVAKAYCTRVGAGPFVSEFSGELGERIRRRGGEYGATTGRPRRIGWFDAVATRYASLVSGATELALMKVDVLGGLDVVKLCVSYLDGDRQLKLPPPTVSALLRCRPLYKEMRGWPDFKPEEWRAMAGRGPSALPEELRAFILAIEDLVGAPVKLLSYGPERGDMLELS